MRVAAGLTNDEAEGGSLLAKDGRGRVRRLAYKG